MTVIINWVKVIKWKLCVCFFIDGDIGKYWPMTWRMKPSRAIVWISKRGNVKRRETGQRETTPFLIICQSPAAGIIISMLVSSLDFESQMTRLLLFAIKSWFLVGRGFSSIFKDIKSVSFSRTNPDIMFREAKPSLLNHSVQYFCGFWIIYTQWTLKSSPIGRKKNSKIIYRYEFELTFVVARISMNSLSRLNWL